MKCKVCGQKYEGKSCPFCGNAEGKDASDAAGFFDAGEDAFGDEFDAPAPAGNGKKAANGRRNGRGGFIILIAVIAAVALSGAALMLIPREQADQPKVIGFAAPTGVFESVDYGVYALTNELLVTMREGYGQKDLEKSLEVLEGAVAGYFPAMHQFQVRFNTDSLSLLDEKRNQLLKAEGVERTDNNLVLTEFPGTLKISFQLPAGQNGAMGILGLLPDAAEHPEHMLFLPSNSFASVTELNEFSKESKGRGIFLSSDQKETLEDGRSVTYAAGCYYEQTETGEFSACVTSAALRYQLFRLSEAGCRIICFAGTDTARTNDLYLQQESEQIGTLLASMEKEDPSFLICLPYQKDGFLYQSITLSETGKRHTLFTAPCSDTEDEIIDTTGEGKKIYRSNADLAGASLGVYCETVFESPVLAAVWAEKNAGTDLSVFSGKLQKNAPALAFDDKGTVVPALDNSYSPGNETGSSAYHAVPVEILDAVTGQALPHSDISITAGTVTERKNSTDGKAILISAANSLEISVSTDGYQPDHMTIHPEQTGSVRMNLHRIQEVTGTISGRVREQSNTGNALLYAIVEDVQTGESYPGRGIEANYQFRMYPGTYQITVTGHDRTPVTVYGVTVRAGENTEIQEIMLTVPSDLPGTVSGQVIDSMNGNTVDDADLRFFSGIDAADSGTPVLHIKSNASGQYSAVLSGGAYTLFASKDGYRTSWRTVYSEGEENTRANQNCTLTPAAREGQVRIALTWGSDPKDLDSHLVNKTAGIHVYYHAKESKNKDGRITAALDHDDTSSYGPEQTTIMIQEPGKYTFYVHDYTNQGSARSNKLAASDATVTVYAGDRDPQIFHVPNRPGTLWEVFSYENGVITPSGEMSYESSASRVGR